MQTEFESLAVRGVQALSPYQPGKPIDELAREFGLDPGSIVKLASNENPLGPSPKALSAIEKTLADLCRYPDGNGFNLKQALSERYGIRPEQITLGNGSNDVLEVISRCFASPGDEVVFSQYAFAVYPLVTQAIGATGVSVPAGTMAMIWTPWWMPLPIEPNWCLSPTRTTRQVRFTGPTLSRHFLIVSHHGYWWFWTKPTANTCRGMSTLMAFHCSSVSPI